MSREQQPAIRFDCVTIFPEMFAAVTQSGITRRALEEQRWAWQSWNPRDFAENAWRRVDDRPFGGGPGMLMQVKAVVAESQGALSLPKGAVFQRGDGDAVRVSTGSGFEERKVQVGLRGSALVEITEGLAEGDQVLLLDAAGNIEKAPAR